MIVTLAELVVADPPEAWREAGFAVDADGVCRVGEMAVRLVGREHGWGIVGWALGGLPSGITELDGVPTTLARIRTDPRGPAPVHPNGVSGVDHVVWMSPDLARTTKALEAVGLEVRRQRDAELGGNPIRQLFFRPGGAILEVIGSPDATSEESSSLWGVTFVVDDIDASAATLGERTSPVKDAVQPGRRITTLRHRDLGMSVRTALITPHVRA